MKYLFPTLPIALVALAAAVQSPIPAEVREKFDLKEHYQQVLLVEGFPIVASDKVHPAALKEAEHTMRSMLKKRPDIFKQLAKNKVRYSIMATSERTCDIPEHSDLTPPEFWNRRARGLGATRQRPSVSCGEESLLHNPGDPYNAESICVHEFAHAIHQMALEDLDPTFDERLKKTYQSATARSLWAGKYAGSNHHEYWAEAVQSWFGTNRVNDHDHNHVNTRAGLIDYDPAVAKLCQEVFGDNNWRYIRADDPSRAHEPHLKNLDRTKLSSFGWTKKEQAAYEEHTRKKKK